VPKWCFTSSPEGPRPSRRQTFWAPRGSLNVRKTHLKNRLKISSGKNAVMCPRGAQRESARHLKSSKNCKKCVPKTHREKDYRKVEKRVHPGALNHSFRMGGVIEIKISPVLENIPKMLPKRLPKRSRNHYKCVSGRLPKNTPKLDASNNALCSKTPPKMDP